MAAPDFRPEPGENVRWTGRPDPSVVFTRSDAFLVPFSLLWAGFAVFWEVSVLNTPGAALFPKIFGAAFALVGAYFVLGRFAVKRFMKTRTVYAVTDKRVVSIVGSRTRALARPVSAIDETRARDGRHLSVVFDGPRVVVRSGRGAGQLWAVGMYRNTGMDFFAPDPAIGFYDVTDVDGLDAALADLRIQTA